jgi:hypothetical protein
MVRTALTLLDNGFSVVPAIGKKPSTPWRVYQIKRPQKTQIIKWFNKYRQVNIAVICGRVSGGLAVLDFDDAETYKKLSMHLVGLPIVKTRKGYHVYLRCEDLIRNKKLAMRDGKVLVEFRGHGGYVIGPGSRHPNGYYKVIYGDIYNTPVLTRSEVIYILQEINKMDERKPMPSRRVYTNGNYSNEITVTDVDIYVNKQVTDALDKVEKAKSSNRNNTLFVSSARIGEILSNGNLKQTDIKNMLFSAAEICGLVGEDGRMSVYQTINSGLKKGARNPIKVHLDPLIAAYEKV